MNKLKPGYKETEVGIIPEDWEVKKILDISVIDKKEQVELKEAAIAKRNVGKTASKEGKAAKTPKAPKEPKVKAEKKTASKPKAKKATK